MVTAEKLIRSLVIVEEDILREAAEHPLRFVAAARYRVFHMRQVATLESQLELKRSRLGLKIRAAKDTEGKKPTEGYVAQCIEVSSETIRLREEVDKAHALEELSKLILEAYRMRRDCLRILADYQNIQGMREVKEVESMDARRKLVSTARELQRRRTRLE